MSRSARRTAAINLRARETQRDLIDAAARALGKNRSDFILETACREAEKVLLDQRLFQLDPEAFDEFTRALETPPDDNEGLRALLSRKAPWD
ncbi:MAG TPA: DUF1778 domain-containing protein [Chromatiales bacterium]|nr:DUF1778 domain-containing protein [Chromatiales bacterium]